MSAFFAIPRARVADANGAQVRCRVIAVTSASAAAAALATLALAADDTTDIVDARPAAIAACDAAIDATHSGRFRWPAVDGAERYVLCIADDARSCTSSQGPSAGSFRVFTDALDAQEPGGDAAGRSSTDGARRGAAPGEAGIGPLWLVVAGPSAEIPGATLARRALLEAFAGRAVQWAVAGCSGGDCRYGATCELEIPEVASSPPAAPELVSPVDLEVVSALAPVLELSWREVPGTIAYRICTGSQQGSVLAAACNSGDADVFEPVTATETSVELPKARAGEILRWTVAACNRAGCSWSGAGRRISLSAMPPAPSLVTPAAGTRVTTPVPTLVWKAVPAAESYKVCVLPPGATCESPAAIVHDVEAGGPTAFVPPAPLLPGRPVAWTVAACVQGRCRYAWPPHRVDVAGLTPPTLISPGDGAAVSVPTVRFRWEPSSAADSYLLCAYDVDAARARGLDARAACDTQRLATRMRTRETSAELTIGGAGAGATTRYAWTVAACHSQSGEGCVYQARPRRLDVDAEYTVELRVESVEIHDDCDAASPGDWVLSVVAFVAGREHRRLVWPAQDAASVSDGQRLLVGERLVVPAVRAQSPVALVVSAVDCDGDALHAYSIPVGDRLGGGPEGVRIGVDCTGEEAWEESGESDAAGAALLELAPEQWIAGGLFTSRSAGGDCGEGAFTVHVSARSVPEERAAVEENPLAAIF